MKINLTEEDYEALLDTMAFSIQLPFEKCRTENCPIYMTDEPCYKYIKDCVEKEWRIEK